MKNYKSRRNFLKHSLQKTIGIGTGIQLASCDNPVQSKHTLPLILSTWKNEKANQAAWESLENTNSILDAVEAGARVPEADPKDQSVGYGGRPDRDGNVTLDACIMDHKGNYGAVTALQHIMHPVSVARKVMEDTPHVMLTGDGALQFALDSGFNKTNLLTDKSKQEWEEWLVTSEYKPKINIELHDTIGILGIDANSNLSGACTTSGLGYKMPGRIGDSPIVGAGLFVDNEIGAATATGMGELVLKSVGSFLIVELMRQGMTPQEACEEGVMRIVRKQDYQELQVGYIAINKAGEIGAYSIQPGFMYTLTREGKNTINEVKSYL